MSKNRLGFNSRVVVAGFGVFFTTYTGCGQNLTIAASAETIPIAQQVQQVAEYLIGAMDSSAQAIANRDNADVRMTTCQVKLVGAEPDLVSVNGTEAIFLYQEQAISTKLDQPYRQRFLRLAPSSDGMQVESKAFRPAVSDRWVGLCHQATTKRSITVQDLGQSVCSVFLSLDAVTGDRYIGNTPEAGCPTNFRGAVKITNQIMLSAERTATWDRGFDAAGKQVWGADDRSYKFADIDPEQQDPQLNAIAAMLNGKFNNAEQHASDPSFLPVRFNNCVVKLEQNSIFSAGEPLLLLEQAANSPELKFASQRLAHLSRSPQNNDQIKMVTYKLVGDNFADFCDRPVDERLLTAEQIGAQECQITYQLSESENKYIGSTSEGGCPSKFRGSSYITIDSQLTKPQVEFWERWYDDNDVQVAGSESGFYIYKPID
jgi:hypothetical protein